MKSGSRIYIWSLSVTLLAIVALMASSAADGAQASADSWLGLMPPSPELLKRVVRGEVELPQVFTDPALQRSLGVNQPMESIQPSGTWRAIALLVQFTDNGASTSATYFDSLLFSTGTGTLKDYYDEVSYGILDIVTVDLPSNVGWMTMPQSYAYYVAGNNGFGTYPQNAQRLAEDAVWAADPVVDYANYDNDGDGYVESLFVIHAGQGAELTGNPNHIWSHKWAMVNDPFVDGVTLNSYTMEPEYWAAPGDMTVGVYAHELAHAYGLPDLYDTDGSALGIGSWGLMAGGSWNGNLGDTPAWFSAWSRAFLGFVTPTNIVTDSAAVSIPAAETSQTVYRLWTNGDGGNEYFLVENRQAIGYDSALAGFGLLIWHIDDSKSGNQQECDQLNNWNCGANHLWVALEQADGLFELENRVSGGDTGDPYPGSTDNRDFDFGTAPNSSSYYHSSDTCVGVSNISDSTSTMTADLNVSSCSAPPVKEHCGLVDADDTWIGNGVIHVVTCDVTVDPGKTLTIEEGAIVKFDYNTELIVNGSLRVLGTTNDPVYLTSIEDLIGGDSNGSNPNNPEADDWTRIRFTESSDSANSLIEYAIIRYGGQRARPIYNEPDLGVLRLEGSSPTIQNTTISENAYCAIQADIESFPSLSNNSLVDNDANGLCLEGGVITADSTWDVTDTAYYLRGDVTVGSGATLTIPQNVLVKFDQNRSLIVNGALQVLGTSAEPVYFTSHNDHNIRGEGITNGDPSSGPAADDWTHIYFTESSDSANSVIEYAVIRYGGQRYSGVYNLPALGVIRLEGSSPTIENTTISDNAYCAIHADVESFPSLSNNSLVDNDANGLCLEGGVITADSTWDVTDTAYYLRGDVTVGSGATLTVPQNVLVKFDQNLSLIINGALRVLGTAAEPVHFTSHSKHNIRGEGVTNGVPESSPAKDDWKHIRFTEFSDSANSLIEYAEIRYGGQQPRPIYGDPALGVLRLEGSSPTITNSTFKQNAYAGVQLIYSTPTLGCNNFEGNDNGMINETPDTVVIAENQWWGDSSGPNDPSDDPADPTGLYNPGGMGDTISDYIDYWPWADSEFCTCAVPEKPTLISPADGAFTSDNTPTLYWSVASNSAEYQVQIDNNSDFSSPDVDDTTAVTSYTPGSPLSDDTYYWRVRGHNNATGCDLDGSWSESRSLDIDTVEQLPTPVLLSPAHSSIISDTTPTLTWGASSGASGYNLDFDGTITDVGNVTEYTTSTLANGTYTWTVSAYDEAGNTSDYATTWSFTIQPVHCGTIDADETWGGNGVIHIITCDVEVAEGITLTVEEGAIVKFSQGTKLTVNGALRILGSAGNEVYLTSIEDPIGGDSNGDNPNTPAADNWDGIHFTDLSRISVLGPKGDANGDCVVDDADYEIWSYYFHPFNPVSGGISVGDFNEDGYVNGQDYSIWAYYYGYVCQLIDHAIIQYGGDTSTSQGAVMLTDAAPTIRNTTISNNAYCAISGDLDSFPILSANTLTDNAANAFCLNDDDDNAIKVNTTWNITDTAYFIRDSNVTITPSVTLTVAENVLVKFCDGCGLTVNGALQATGTITEPVYFTTVQDDNIRGEGDTGGDGSTSIPAPGDWDSIHFTSLSSTSVQAPGGDANGDCAVDDADYEIWQANFEPFGGPVSGGVSVGDFNEDGYVDGQDFAIWSYYSGYVCQLIDHAIIRYGGDEAAALGSVMLTETSATIRNTTFTNNAYAAISFSSATSSTLKCNSVYSNTTYGIYNDTPETIVDAEYQWWGTPNGPTHASNPLADTGDMVSDGIDFDPWLNSPCNFQIAEATNLTATAVASDTIELSWQDNTGDETEFRIERSLDGNTDWTEIGTVAEDTTSFSDTGLDCNTSYYYRVRAYRAIDDNYSIYSNVASATTYDCGQCNTPGTPVLISPPDGTITSDNTPTFVWSEATDAAYYQIEIVNQFVLTVGSTSHTPGNALSDGTYYWHVRGQNAAGDCNLYGPWSDSWSFTVETTPTVQFSASTYTVDEGVGTATIDVTLSAVSALAITVNYTTSDGTATAPEDYGTSSGPLTFDPGVTSLSFTVSIVEDLIDETTETVNLALLDPTNATLGTPSSAVLNINDNDAPPVVSFSSATYTADEGDGFAPIQVTLSPTSGKQVSVNYATNDGTANEPDDYTATSGILTFDPGQSSLTFNVPIVGDGDDEPTETVNLALSTPSNASLGSQNTAVLNILDDDEPGGGGPVTHEGTVTGGSGSSTSVSTDAAVTAASNDLYLAAISTKGHVAVTAVTGMGLAWTQLDVQCAGRNQTGVAVWMAQGSPTGDEAVTATLASAPRNAVIAVTRYSGVAASNPVGDIASANTNGVDGGCSGGTDSNSYSVDVSTTVADAMVYSAVGMRTAQNTPGSGYTELADYVYGVSGVAVQEGMIAAPSTVAANGTLSKNVDWAAIALEIKPGGGGGPAQYSLTANSNGQGSVSLNPPGGVYDEGTVVSVMANADSGWEFDHWSGHLGGTTNPALLTMDSDKTVTATFVETSTIQYGLTVSTVGSGSGTVSSNPPGIDCGTDCTQDYADGTNVTLTAQSAMGSTFIGWSGSGCTGTGPCTVSMTAARSVTAEFTINYYRLDVTKSGSGSGTVTSSPPGINCGADCDHDYAYDTNVTLTPAPAAGSTFAGWSGACTGTGGCTVSMIAARSVDANFSIDPPQTLDVGKTGTGNGDVTSDPAGIDCGTDCSHDYPYGTSVTLTATPDAGSTFTGWSGACSGTGPCTVSMTAARSVTADFTINYYRLDISKSGSGSGTVTSDPLGIDCGADCDHDYAYGTDVTLTATPAQDSTFTGWSGGGCSGTGSCTVTMTTVRSVTAQFTATGGGGQVTYEATFTGGSSGSSSVSTAGPVAGGTGDLYLAAISTKNHVEVNDVTGLGLNWAPLRNQCGGRNQAGVSVWEAHGAATAGVVTASLAGTPKNAVIAVTQYSGVDLSDPIGAVVWANTNGSDTAATCGGGSDSSSYSVDLTTTVNNAVVYGAAGLRSTSHTPGSGYTERDEVSQGSGGGKAGVAVQDMTVANSGTTVAVEGTLSKNVDWAVIGVEIKPGGGGGPTQYSLTTSISGQGSVSLNPAGGTYDAGTVVSVMANADSGWQFDHWSGDLGGSDNPALVTMNANKAVTAHFIDTGTTQYQLTVSVVGSGSGTVTSTPPGIDCGTDCDHDYADGTNVTLTAQSDTGSTFTGWSGGICSGTGTCMVSMTAARSVTAEFTIDYYRLDVTKSGSGSGTVMSSPPGIDCGADCDHDYAYGTNVTLAPTPAAGSTFAGWGGACTGTGSCTVSMTAARSVDANFSSDPPQTLNVGKTGTGDGTVTSDPASIDCGADCSHDYPYGTSVTLTATPDAGSTFTGWSGACSGTGTCTLSMTTGRSVTAQFTATGGGGQVTHEGTVTGGSGSSTSVSTDAAVRAAANDLYLAAISTKGHVAVTAVSGMGLAWTQLDVQCAGRNQTGIAVWMAQGSPTGDEAVTATLASAPRNAVIAVSRYSGVATSSPVGGIVSANTNGLDGACSGGSDNNSYSVDVSTTVADAMVYSAVGLRTAQNTPGSGYTELVDTVYGVSGLAAQERMFATPSTVAANGTLSKNIDWAVIAFEIRPG